MVLLWSLYSLQVVQLYETTLARHGLMLVGPTMAGKTCCYKVLARALTALHTAGEGAYQRVSSIQAAGLCLHCHTQHMNHSEQSVHSHSWAEHALVSSFQEGSVHVC
jgi:dynein heavy chain